MSTSPTNIYGRKGGRGVRPYFLLPKLLCVAVFIGSYASATALWFRFRSQGSTGDPGLVLTISFLFTKIVVPSLVGVLVFGILLWLQHPRVFLRRRWLQVKLCLVALLFALHFFARGIFLKIRHAHAASRETLDAGGLETLYHQFTSCLLIGLFIAATIVIAGRHKPRLGQQPRPVPRRIG